jgi:hypothetical protein
MILPALDSTKKQIPSDIELCQESIKNLQTKYDVHTQQLLLINKAMSKLGIVTDSKIPALFKPKM